MRIEKLTTDRAKEAEAGVKAKDGYCCCEIFKTNDTKCMCKDFRDKIADSSFEGECNCGLYYKHLE